ncbi:MAG: hypothetical protein ACRDN6_07585 [Gaiellaceae bacterium]
MPHQRLERDDEVRPRGGRAEFLGERGDRAIAGRELAPRIPARDQDEQRAATGRVELVLVDRDRLPGDEGQRGGGIAAAALDLLQ